MKAVGDVLIALAFCLKLCDAVYIKQNRTYSSVRMLLIALSKSSDEGNQSNEVYPLRRRSAWSQTSLKVPTTRFRGVLLVND
jgi:hypothetical protein